MEWLYKMKMKMKNLEYENMETSLILKEKLDVVESPVDLNDLMSAFFSNKSQCTIRAYRTDLESFSNFVQVDSITDATRILLESGQGQANLIILKYKQSLLESGKRSNTINRQLSSIRSIVSLARSIGLVTWSLEIKNEPVQTYRDCSGPGKSNIKRMLDHLEKNPRSKKSTRDFALVRLAYDLGLRRNEIVTLDLSDVDLENSKIKILGKGRREKETLSLPQATQQALQAWLNVRGNQDGPLFISLWRAYHGQPKRLSGDGLRYLIQDLGEKLNLKVRPHGIRHSSITCSIQQAAIHNFDLCEVMTFSRHKSLSTLQLYKDADRDSQGQLATLVSQSI